MRGALALLALAACGGAQQQIKVEPSKPAKPASIGTLPKEAGIVFVVGIATRSKSLEEGKAAAQASSTAQVSSVVGTSVKSQASDRMSTSGDNFSKSEVEAQTQAFIKSLVGVDEYYEKTTKMVGSYYEESYDVWVLSKFPLNAADEERKRQAVEKGELAHDAFKRFSDAAEEQKKGSSREAWILLSQAAKTLAALPAGTEIHQGGFDTAADLARAVDKQLRGLDESARGVKVELEPSDDPAKKATKAFTGQLSEALTKAKAIVRAKGEARFTLKIELSSKLPSEKVMGQTVAYVTYSGTVEDAWSGGTLPGASGEVKGFGKSGDAAMVEATREAAAAIAKNVGAAIAGQIAKDSK